MLGYVTLGTSDMVKACAFYDALAKEMGGKRAMESDRFVFWTNGRQAPMVGVIKPYDGNAQTVGNGVMVALAAKDPAQVDRIYKLAMDMGAKDEGAPGDRGGGFYAGYFRDPDGNKLNAFCMG